MLTLESVTSHSTRTKCWPGLELEGASLTAGSTELRMLLQCGFLWTQPSASFRWLFCSSSWHKNENTSRTILSVVQRPARSCWTFTKSCLTPWRLWSGSPELLFWRQRLRSWIDLWTIPWHWYLWTVDLLRDSCCTQQWDPPQGMAWGNRSSVQLELSWRPALAGDEVTGAEHGYWGKREVWSTAGSPAAVVGQIWCWLAWMGSGHKPDEKVSRRLLPKHSIMACLTSLQVALQVRLFLSASELFTQTFSINLFPQNTAPFLIYVFPLLRSSKPSFMLRWINFFLDLA